MQKIAFKMQLKPGCREEYKRRHETVWPELKALLKENGISDYTIFLDEASNTLFAVQVRSSDRSSQALGADPLMQKWWAYMADISVTNPDNSPVSTPLEEVFHMD
ncbi:MAG TPA: L-rhamnose mutarotase [Anseongella sp.]|nr:L-rhamnose mutarotase [Anseongella sp.]